MSSLVIEVCQIKEILPHDNSDNLELCRIKGWQCVIRKDTFTKGQKVIYFPPDTPLPKRFTDAFGVSNYCSEKPEGMRIRQARLRGEPSFGLVIASPDESWDVGKDVADFYEATKYEPPVLGKAGDILGGAPSTFIRYVDIENLQNFPDIFKEGEEVIATEKVDGTNVRIGIIEGEWFAGSHNHARKKPETDELMRDNFYWSPLIQDTVKNLLADLSVTHNIAILFGETYGRVQKLRYGLPKSLAFMAFDIYIDGVQVKQLLVEIISEKA